MNKVILVGNITKDPEIKMTPDGTTVATLAIATNEFYKDQSGQKQQATEFHNLTAFGKLADTLQSYVTKGQKLLVEGKMKTRSWETQDGQKRYATYVLIEKIEFLGGGEKKQNDNVSDDEWYEEEMKKQSPQKPAAAAVKKTQPRKEEEISIEDIPF